MLKASGLDWLGLRMTFETFERTKANRDAFDAAVEWSKEPAVRGRKGILLYGSPGTGKTHLGCAVVQSQIREHGVFSFVQKVPFMPRDDQDAVLRLADFAQVPLLLLDDIGAEKPTPRALECLYDVVEGRLWGGAPLLATTNYLPDGLAEHLNEAGDVCGDRIVGRLRESCEFIKVGGKDRRK